jgi:long-subunit fatty acid transport protein
MEVKKGESIMNGVYTGHVKQEVKEWMLTLPVQLSYRLSEKVQLKAGPYLSYLIDKEFSGYVYDGYLRQGDPTGPKVTMGKEENERATYEFNDDMRDLQFGVGVGADWQVAKQFGVFADLNWGLNGIFKSDFKTVEQTLFPIYGTIGVSYRIK